jgi:hypothetical protein
MHAHLKNSITERNRDIQPAPDNTRGNVFRLFVQ